MELPHSIVALREVAEISIRQQRMLAQPQYDGVDPADGIVKAAHLHAVVADAMCVPQVFQDVLVLSHHRIQMPHVVHFISVSVS